MAWSTPTNLSAGQVVTATTFNQYTVANPLALCTWTTVVTSSGQFTGSGSMTWGVSSTDVSTMEYRQAGKTMRMAFYIATSSVGGTPAAALQIAIPNSATVATGKTFESVVRIINNGVGGWGAAQAASGASVIGLYCGPNCSTAWTASTDNTYVMGQIEFETA